MLLPSKRSINRDTFNTIESSEVDELWSFFVMKLNIVGYPKIVIYKV